MQSARGFEYGVRHIISETSGSLFDVLLSTLDLTPFDSQQLLHMGAIYLNHKRLNDNILIRHSDYLRVHTKPRRFLPDDGLWASRVLFCNDHFIVARKVAGLPVHASVDNTIENLHNYLQKALNTPLYVTHRLDVPTKGLIVFAKTVEFQMAFNKLLADREMKKIYRAVVEGQNLTPQILRHFMEPSPRAPKKVSSTPHPQWQECVLEILEVKTTRPDMSELRIQLLTGRTHQIRAQLQEAQHPIVGDVAYGAKTILENKDEIELEACELQFKNPLTGEGHHFKI